VSKATVYKPTQAGTVLVFKPGVTQAQAEAALAKLLPLLSSPPRVNMFDPEWGGPVWYVP